MNQCFVKRGDWVAREIAGETVIVPVRSHADELDSIYTLNELAALIWQQLDGRTNVDQIVAAVCQEYDADPQEVRQDAVAFLREMEEAGLIRRERGLRAED